MNCHKCQKDIGPINPDFGITRFMCDPCLAEYKAQQRKDEWIHLLTAAGIPKNYWQWDEALGNNELLKWVLANVRESIWLGGKTGICKTRSLCRAAAISLWKEPSSTLYAFSPDYFRELGLLMLSDDQEFQKRVIRAKNTSLLILDDLGNEKLTERGAELLFSIIDYRCRELKRTWITSNSTADEFDNHVGRSQGAAIRRRMRETSKQWGGNEK